MAVWRRRAIETFPMLRARLNRRDYDLSDLCWDIEEIIQHAATDDAPALLNAYLDFAMWCFQQPDLRELIVFEFYSRAWRHFPRQDWDVIVSRFPAQAIRMSWQEWNQTLPYADLLDLRRMIRHHLEDELADDELPIGANHRPRRRGAAEW